MTTPPTNPELKADNIALSIKHLRSLCISGFISSEQMVTNVAIRIVCNELERLRASSQPQEPCPSCYDYPEDWSHENGNYQCRCIRCDIQFIGHKRRVLCKVCNVKQPQESVSEWPCDHILRSGDRWQFKLSQGYVDDAVISCLSCGAKRPKSLSQKPAGELQ